MMIKEIPSLLPINSQLSHFLLHVEGKFRDFELTFYTFICFLFIKMCLLLSRYHLVAHVTALNVGTQ